MALVWKGDEVVAEIEQRAQNLAHTVAEMLLENATPNVPVWTGDLQLSGIVIDLDNGTVIVAYPLFYAHFVEFGTIQNDPNPFLRNAVASTIPEARVLLNAR